MAKNVLPVVENVLKSIAETVKEQGPDMITKFVAYATEKLPEVLKLGLQLVVSLVKGLAQNLPELLRGVLALVDAIIDSFWTPCLTSSRSARTLSAACGRASRAWRRGSAKRYPTFSAASWTA
ncbi:MAG: hypothetical protein ACLSHJ_06830 [Oscillospiraceae bacterium]